MRRLIVTGANGAGKSRVAAILGAARPEIAVVSFDAIKLLRGWTQRPRPEIDAALLRIVQGDAWILEGGPSLLPLALDRAEGVIWLDPPLWVRAWRLALRPWRSLGRTRAELPPGNPDWPFEQYVFAIRSLRRNAKFRGDIEGLLAGAKGVRVWHVRGGADLDAAIAAWTRGCSCIERPVIAPRRIAR